MHTHGTHKGGKSVVCSRNVVCTHKGEKSVKC